MLSRDDAGQKLHLCDGNETDPLSFFSDATGGGGDGKGLLELFLSLNILDKLSSFY